MPKFERGMDAIDKSIERSNTKKEFKPFAPTIRLKDSGEEKYVLFLIPMDEVPKVQMHEFIPLPGGGWGFYIARNDRGIGERTDEIEDRLDHPAKERNISVAVELEPKIEVVRGRKKPNGFEVALGSFERRVPDSDDDEEREEVVYPKVGLVSQAPINFFGYLTSHERSEETGPVVETPFKIQRRGKDSNTQYDFTPYDLEPDQIDLSAIREYAEGISYLRDEEGFEDLGNIEDNFEYAQALGNMMLEKRLDELSDKDTYDAEVGTVEEIPKFGGGKKSGGKRGERKSQGPRDNGNGGEPKNDESRKGRFDKIKEEAAKKKAEKAEKSE